MRDAAVAAQVGIPGVIFGFEALGGHQRLQNIETLLALAAADDFADAGNEQIHRGGGFAIVVLTHVEGFDAFRVVEDGHGAFDVLLGQKALVLGLQAFAPNDGVFEAAAGFEQNIDRVGVADALEGFCQRLLQSRDELFVDELVEELQFVRALVKHGLHEVTHLFLRERHVVEEVVEGHFGLDHPKLGRVARGVAVLRAERRPEGVNIAQRACKGLALKLAADGEVGRTAKEVLLGLGGRVWLQRGDLKHLARAFAVAAGDDRRVDVEKAALLEETMHGKGHLAAHAEDAAEEIRARTQMRDGAEEFRRVAFLLQRVGRIGLAEEFEFLGLHFPFLAGSR